MATIKLYSNRYSFIYLDVTYSVSAGTFTLEKIVGYSTNSSYYGGSNHAKNNHYLTLPDGQVVNFATTASGGYGVKTSGWTWGLTGTLSFSVAEGKTGTIAIQDYVSSTDYVYEAIYTSIDKVTVPSSAPHNPVSSVSFDKTNYGINDKVTISWTAASSGSVTPDRYDVFLFRNDTYDSYSQSAELTNSTFSYTFPYTPAEKGWSIGDACTTLVRSWYNGSNLDYYIGYHYNSTYPKIISVPTVSNVTASNITPTSVDVSFTANANEGNISSTYIWIFDTTQFDDNGNYLRVGEINNSYSGTFNNLTPNTMYQIWAGAYNEAGKGESQSSTWITTLSQQNATISYHIENSWADAIKVDIVVDNMNDATAFTQSPNLVATAPDGTTITAVGWEGVILKGLMSNTTYTLDITAYTDLSAISERTFFTTLDYIAPELTYSIWQSDQNLMGRVTIDNPGNAYEINLGWRELYELPVGQSYPNIYDGYDIKLDEDYTFTGLTNFEEGTQYSASITLEDSTGNFYQFDSNTIIIQSSTPSILPIHISLNGQAFQNCPVVKISVDGGDFKILTNNALKII